MYIQYTEEIKVGSVLLYEENFTEGEKQTII